MLRSERDLLRKGSDTGKKREAVGQKQAFTHYNFSALTREVQSLTRQLSEEANQLINDLTMDPAFPPPQTREQQGSEDLSTPRAIDIPSATRRESEVSNHDDAQRIRDLESQLEQVCALIRICVSICSIILFAHLINRDRLLQ